MRSFIPNLISAAAIVLFQNTFPLHAQDSLDPVVKVAEMTLREDKVSADLSTTADRRTSEVYDRRVILSGNGAYMVTITDAAGNVRMEGSYIDADLKVADGEFTFYYPNGNVESQGVFANGLKTGIWHRYNADGSDRAERVYTGMAWEELAVSLGMYTMAGRN